MRTSYLHIYHLDPVLTVELYPTTLTVLDTSSYDTVILTCYVTQPQAVSVPKRIWWEQTSSSGTVQILSQNGINTNITTTGLESPASSSMLYLYASLPGRWRYTCKSSIQIPRDPVISYSQTTEVTVKGMPM